MQKTSKLNTSVQVSKDLELMEEDQRSSTICNNSLQSITPGPHADSSQPCISEGSQGFSHLELQNSLGAKTHSALKCRGEKDGSVLEREGLKPGDFITPSRRKISTSQPIPSKPRLAAVIEKEGGNNCIDGDLVDRASKKPKLVYGLAAFGGCNNCKKIKTKMSYDIAMVKKKASTERTKYEKKIKELHDNQDQKAAFAQNMCIFFKNERDELKKENLLLLKKINELKKVLNT